MSRRAKRSSAAILGAAGLLLTACGPVSTTRPGAGLVLISKEQEFALGDEFAESLRKDAAAGKVALVPQPAGGYLDALGRTLTAVSQRPGVPYQFSFINEDTINAFAVPGHVYVYRGLVELAETEGEFAAALAHEIGHVVGRHSAKNVSKEMSMSLGAEVVLVALGDTEFNRIAANLILTGAIKKYGRDEERQADLLGVEECAAAGIDPHGAVALFRKFEKTFAERPNAVEGFFADHPFSGERADNVGKHIATLRLQPGLRTDSPAYRAWRKAVLSAPAAPPAADSSKK
ncbi:MAG: M48 family metalloprotease [bacterium]